ncbi:hypothetical protein [Kingella kingae]|uniref:hypothetical protein n=1 Tax=Kingella kingae TaxID=504 RepID=UPI00041BA928|nr:hypothetical protein [Kingella kingae]
MKNVWIIGALALSLAACGGSVWQPATQTENKQPNPNSIGDQAVEMRKKVDSSAAKVQGAMQQSTQQIDQEMK